MYIKLNTYQSWLLFFRSKWERRTWGQALGGIVKKAGMSVLTSVLGGAEDTDNVRFAVSEVSTKNAAAKMLDAVQKAENGHDLGAGERVVDSAEVSTLFKDMGSNSMASFIASDKPLHPSNQYLSKDSHILK